MSPFRDTPPAYVEIAQQSLTALAGDVALKLPITRTNAGRISQQSADEIAARLRDFLEKQSPRPTRVYCAISARGVSLRRITIPASGRDDLERLLALQMEREFPLPPGELAWGWQWIDRDSVPSNGSPGTDSILVAAVKREVLQEYADLFAKCALEPTFTVAALDRASLAAASTGACALLEVGEAQSELVSINNGVAASIRIVPWGRKQVVEAVTAAAGITESEAQRQLADAAISNATPAMNSGLAAACGQLGTTLDVSALGKKVYLTGESSLVSRIAPHLENPRTAGIAFAPLTHTVPGQSAAIEALKQLTENGRQSPPLVLRTGRISPETVAKAAAAQPSRWKWAALAAVLAIVAVALRYAEPFVYKSRLAKRITELKTYRDKLPALETELGFLQHLQTNQPPYLPLFTAMAEASPPGTRIESLSVSRSGAFSARATMRDAQQVADFRTKLIRAGWFLNLSVDDQTVVPNQQKVNVRLTGQWNPSASPAPSTSSQTNARPDRPITAPPPRPDPNT